MKYEKIIITFIVLLAVFSAVIFIQRFTSGREGGRTAAGIEDVKRENEDLRFRLNALEKAVDPARPSSNPSAAFQVSGDITDRFVTVLVNRENIDSISVWNNTKMPGISFVNVSLTRDPAPETIMVWTGMGVLPVNAYKVQDKTISVIMQQSKEDFIASNNYINIRYIARSNP